MALLFPVLSVPLLVLSAYFLTSLVSQKITVLTAITFYVTLNAQLVLTAIVLSLFQVLDLRGAWLVMQVLMAIAAGAGWQFFGKPHIEFPSIRQSLQTLRETLKSHPYLMMLVVIVALAYIYGAFLILYYPPNNHDGMSYRLPRVMYWLQFGAMFPWETADPRQVTFPPNAEIGVLYTFLLAGTDHLAGFVQWTAALISAVTVYGFGRLLGFNRPASSSTALLYLTLTQVYLQSTSVQNDLVVSAYFAIALYGFFLGINRRHYPTLTVSAVALGLSLGAKFTAPLMIPGFLIVILVYWLRHPRRDFRMYLSWGMMCIGAFAIFGSFIYVTNTLWYASPTGPARHTSSHVGMDESRGQLLLANMPRYVADMIDFTSVREPLGRYLHQTKHRVFDKLFEGQPAEEISNLDRWVSRETFFHSPSEDRSWFGLTGFLVFVPGLIYGIVRAIRDPKNRWIWSSLVLLCVAFFLVHSAFQAYTPAKGRYYLLPITAGGVLMIWLFAYSNTLAVIYRVLILCLVVTTTLTNTLYGIKKPVYSLIREHDRASLRALSPVRDFWWQQIDDSLDGVPVVGLIADNNAWIYPLFDPPVQAFGSPLQRTVVPIMTDANPLDLTDIGTIPFELLDSGPADDSNQQQLSHLVIYTNRTVIPGDYVRLFETNEGLTLYQLAQTLPEQAMYYFDFDRPFPADGLAASRRINGESVQWITGTQASIRPFRLADSAGGYQLTLDIPYAINPDVRDSLRLSVNDSPVTLQADQNGMYDAYIPASVINQNNGVFDIQLMVDDTQSLAQTNGANAARDASTLALDWLRIEPATSDSN